MLVLHWIRNVAHVVGERLKEFGQAVAERLWSAGASIGHWFLNVFKRIWDAVTHPNVGSITVWTFIVSGIALVSLVVVSAVIAYGMPVISAFSMDSRSQHYRDIAERSVAVALFDQKHRFVGYPNRREEIDFANSRVPVFVNDFEITPDHKSIIIKDAPPHYWNCLVDLEDRRLRQAWNPNGIDFLGVLQMPFSAVSATIASGKPSLGRGGSTIHMQLVRSMLKRFSNSPGMNVLQRRWIEWHDATILSRMLEEKDGDDPLRRWAAMHMPHIQGGPEGTVYGVETAGYVMFGQAAAELSPSKQFLLAASVNHPIQILDAKPTDEWRRLTYGFTDKTGEFRTGRARLCAERLLTDDKAKQEAIEELKKLSESAPPIGVNAAFLPILKSSGATEAELRRIAVSPESLTSRIAGDIGRGVVAELRDQYGALYRRNVGGVRLTIDIVKNQAFKRMLSGTVHALDQRLGNAIKRPNYRLDLASTSLSIVVVAADDKGRIVRYVDNSLQTPYFGLANRRERDETGARGSYQTSLETRPVGSVAKISAVLALADTGAETAESLWDNHCVLESKRRCYVEGSSAPRTVTARTALAQSLNDALINRFTELPDRVAAKIEPTLAAFGFNTENNRTTPIQTRAALGLVAGTPRAVQMLTASALAAARAQGDAAAYMPTLIGEYYAINTTNGEGQWLPYAGTDAVKRSAGLKINATGAAFVRDTLSAPVCEKRGTLTALGQWCADETRVRMLLAKTGTPSGREDSNGFNEFDWWLTGAIEFTDGRRYSFVILIGTGSPGLPFARNKGGGALAPLADSLLRDLYNNGS